MDDIFVFSYQYQILLKIFHFQTKSYTAHKASDKHLENVIEKFDLLLEVMQGKFGRIKFGKGTQELSVNNLNHKEDMIKLTEDQNNHYQNVIDDLEDENGSNDEIINIVEEMIADNEHFIYLLSFE